MLKYIAYYAADNQMEEFATYTEALTWLQDLHLNDGLEDGFTNESLNGMDFIAIKTHISQGVVVDLVGTDAEALDVYDIEMVELKK
jgi:hypothetical protein